MAARSPAPMRRLLNIYRLGVKELISLWNDKVLLIMIIWAFSGGIYSAATANAVLVTSNLPAGTAVTSISGR